MSFQFFFVNFKLYRILFNSATNYDEINLTFDNNIFNNNEVIFIMKEKSNEDYFLSFVWFHSTGDSQSNTYNEVMSLQLINSFETNSCLSLNNQVKSNELLSFIVGQNSTNNEKGIYNIYLLNWTWF